MTKFLSSREAVDLIKDGDALAVNGFIGTAHPEALSSALEERFLETGKPEGLTLVYAAGQGDRKNKSLNHLGHEKLLTRVIGGHWNMAPALGKLAAEEKVAAYNLPQGVISQLYRDIAAGNLGTITHVGLKTFVDPRLDGGKINKTATEDIVELVTIAGHERLLYKAMPLNACLIRGTYADEKGNVSMEHEGVVGDATAMAQAVKNSGGIVIVQVAEKVRAGSLDPRMVKLPHILVDVVAVVGHELNQDGFGQVPRLACCGELRLPPGSVPALPFDERKIIGRRAAMELTPGSVVNLGIGMPETIAAVAAEEGISDYMSLTVEAGPVGGIPAGGFDFGLSVNPEAILDQNAQFDFYDGGGLDIANLGLAECDEAGNINVSKLGAHITGCGGFINITQNAKRLFFCGTFTAKNLVIAVHDGKLHIEREGATKKFIKRVGHVTFSGEYAAACGQSVTYITERAVFELRRDGLHLTEIAPGVDPEKDVLAQMEFRPKMDTPPKLMDERIFRPGLMGLSDR
ncbi:Acetate CoA-transferase YdiF [uncultured delta proteobacterium]|uniref:Acetate CoA-transferase YdiF n=1 Tax=uncultured delta proteobacterium TaxID=34034 RepID=A0A212JK70_9DELT|nr:Acetate CoA-transferase YdiF [uncultured delta proteobacterium]